MRLFVLGVPVDLLPLGGVLQLVDEYVAGTRPRQIVTANALMVLAARHHPSLKEALLLADLSVSDSIGVAVAAALAGRRVLARLCGIDLMNHLCGRAANKGWRVFLLGSAPGVAEEAERALKERYPLLRVAGVHHGYFKAGEEEAAVIDTVSRFAPDLLFVAMDSPRQDAWIRQNKDRLGAKVAMGVGGSFDVLSGRLRRAPGWMQRAGLEWLFRLIQQPSRLRRMAGLPLFACLAWPEALGSRFRRPSGK